MGSILPKNNYNPKMIRKEPFQVTNENGYIFNNKFDIPEEVLTLILSYVEPVDLVFKCRRVCKTWCNVIDFLVWRVKFQQNNFLVHKVQELPWYSSYWIFRGKNLWGRNLIKNGCGQENLDHWEIRENKGDGWRVEKPPFGSEDFPVDIEDDVKKFNSCFATSFGKCIKEQTVDFIAEGASQTLMDFLQPDIVVSEWYSGRSDCLSTYAIKVLLCNENKMLACDKSGKPLTKIIVRLVGAADGWEWHKVTHVFKNYGPGIRYVIFQHGGKDRQFWKGYYGGKMTGASVVLQIPDNLIQSKALEDQIDEKSALTSNHNTNFTF